MTNAWDEEEIEPIATVVEKPESNPLAKIEKALDPLKITITDMVIKTEDDREKTHDMRGDLKKVENLIKEYTQDNIDPINKKVKRLKAGLKPYSDKVKELIDVIKRANQKWDTAKLKAEQEQKRKAEEALEREKAEAAKKLIEDNKKGEKAPVEVLEKLHEEVAPTQTAQRKTDKGTESVKLVKVWFILLQDGTEWNKTTRLPLEMVKGRAGPAVPYVMVDRVQIQTDFEAGKELPHWIHVEERADSRFRG